MSDGSTRPAPGGARGGRHDVALDLNAEVRRAYAAPAPRRDEGWSTIGVERQEALAGIEKRAELLQRAQREAGGPGYGGQVVSKVIARQWAAADARGLGILQGIGESAKEAAAAMKWVAQQVPAYRDTLLTRQEYPVKALGLGPQLSSYWDQGRTQALATVGPAATETPYSAGKALAHRGAGASVPAAPEAVQQARRGRSL